MNKLTFYEYLRQNNEDLAKDIMCFDEDKLFLDTITPDMEGFAKMMLFMSDRGICLSWVFDIFLDSWGKYYKAATGKIIY